MESLGSFAYEEMDSISRILFNDEADFTLQQLFQQDDDDQGLSYEAPTLLLPCDQENSNVMDEVHDSLRYLSDPFNSNVHYLSQETTYVTTHNHIPALDSSSESVEYIVNANEKMDSTIPISSNETMKEAAVFLNEVSLSNDIAWKNVSVSSKKSQLKRKAEMPDHQAAANESSGKPKKKSRVPRDAHRTEKSNKNKITDDDGHVISGGRNGLTSTSYSSDNESQGPETLNQTEETRASRGCATDPQSLYARKRREKINERLKILQNLVPNGTKVDISTMLEEAVNYVKFLQLQIKLLSSDDMWMYAPIAYNGIDIGLDRKISQFL